MATGRRGRDTSKIIQVQAFLDQDQRGNYLKLEECLSPTLQLTKPFPLLHIEENDQIIKINNIDVRQSSLEQFMTILKGLTPNYIDVGSPKGDEILKLTYIKGSDLKPERHLSVYQVALHILEKPIKQVS